MTPTFWTILFVASGVAHLALAGLRVKRKDYAWAVFHAAFAVVCAVWVVK